jgi:hypothetical protein
MSEETFLLGLGGSGSSFVVHVGQYVLVRNRADTSKPHVAMVEQLFKVARGSFAE